MPEWSNGAVSKTVDQLAWSQGSNPCLSARIKKKRGNLLVASLLLLMGCRDYSAAASPSPSPAVALARVLRTLTTSALFGLRIA